MTTLAIIGGSGLYDLEGLTDVGEEVVDTPFGSPSAPIKTGLLGNTKLLFLARHGIGHTLLPSEVPYLANIYALKLLGAEWCLSVSAVGSLQEQYAPGHMVVPNQLIDRTRGRRNTFFGDGIVGHVAFGDPMCPVLFETLAETAASVCEQQGTRCHKGGTYVCMEGPAFSTRAESELYRSWGADVIGMTNLPEAKLAREAEIAYATLAMVTDYDCWRGSDSEVDVSEILRILGRNVETAKKVVRDLVPRLEALQPSPLAKDALQYAILTSPEAMSDTAFERLKPLIGRWVNK